VTIRTVRARMLVGVIADILTAMTTLPARVAQVARDYRQALGVAFPGRVRAVRVFGSVARGEAHEDSDVDVLVLLQDATFTERGRAIDLATELGLAADLVLAPVVLTQVEWDDLVRRERLLPQEIERDGVDA
jgi:predicted nucleotidyltransferase